MSRRVGEKFRGFAAASHMSSVHWGGREVALAQLPLGDFYYRCQWLMYTMPPAVLFPSPRGVLLGGTLEVANILVSQEKVKNDDHLHPHTLLHTLYNKYISLV